MLAFHCSNVTAVTHPWFIELWLELVIKNEPFTIRGCPRQWVDVAELADYNCKVEVQLQKFIMFVQWFNAAVIYSVSLETWGTVNN